MRDSLSQPNLVYNNNNSNNNNINLEVALTGKRREWMDLRREHSCLRLLSLEQLPKQSS